VITGTTSGIGYHTAKKLASAGANLVMINRNPEKALKVVEEITSDFGVHADSFIADLQKLAEVREIATQISREYPQIHVLINNAGVFNKRRKLTPDGNEMTFGVLHLASFLLTKLLTENLKAGSPSRVIFVNSEAHRFGGLNLKDLKWEKRLYIGLLAYGAANIAKIQTALVLAEQLKEDRVTVNLMHPGAVKSNIGMNNPFFYRFYKRYILNWFLKDPAISSEAIYFLAADPAMEKVTGTYFNLTTEEKPARYVVRPSRQNDIWERSEALIGPYLKGNL
jgi:NAD(P)-dependent dehydrogenase (short-subunit alcohol dehydrogenase family)